MQVPALTDLQLATIGLWRENCAVPADKVGLGLMSAGLLAMRQHYGDAATFKILRDWIETMDPAKATTPPRPQLTLIRSDPVG